MRHACGITEDVSLTSVSLSHLFPLMSVRRLQVSEIILLDISICFDLHLNLKYVSVLILYAGTRQTQMQMVGHCSIFFNEKQQNKCIAMSQL